jgi:FKBP-type peptidyl-prolyl cis-trans isomerase SlyD
MQITKPCVVSLTWRLSDAQGGLIDELAEPVEFLVGGEDLLAKIEEALIGQSTGFEAALHLEPEHAFGEYDSSLVFFEERAALPEPLEVGMHFDGVPPGAKTPDMPPDAIYTVTEIYPDHVVLDGNHPLAGIALNIELTVRAVRDATTDEIEAGSVSPGALSILTAPPAGSSLH